MQKEQCVGCSHCVHVCPA
ncbi:MAG: 4Fe-4S binding protein [Marinilabiliales bacterium]|nr:4Fe-4S binding protein [Marinilabiliales bacterium]